MFIGEDPPLDGGVVRFKFLDLLLEFGDLLPEFPMDLEDFVLWLSRFEGELFFF